MKPEWQEKAASIFHHALSQNGLLVLDSEDVSESVSTIFDLSHEGASIFTKARGTENTDYRLTRSPFNQIRPSAAGTSTSLDKDPWGFAKEITNLGTFHWNIPEKTVTLDDRFSGVSGVAMSKNTTDEAFFEELAYFDNGISAERLLNQVSQNDTFLENWTLKLPGGNTRYLGLPENSVIPHQL